MIICLSFYVWLKREIFKIKEFKLLKLSDIFNNYRMLNIDDNLKVYYDNVFFRGLFRLLLWK